MLCVNRLLQEKSQGVASWCEQLLQSMCQDGTISLEPLHGATFTEQMVQPGDIFLPRRASHIALVTEEYPAGSKI